MTIRETGKGIVKSTGGTYQIGFTDLYGEEHETYSIILQKNGIIEKSVVPFLIP